MIDIVIPVHGQFDLLSKCLDSIPDAFEDIPYRIYIYDNASPGDDIRTFYEQYPVRVTYSKNNVGFPLACNLGARKGKNKFIFFLNSDVYLDPGSGKQLVSNFDDEEIGIVGMKLLFADNRHARRNPNVKDLTGKVQHVGLSFNINAVPHHIFLGWNSDNPRVNKLREVPAVTGAALMIRRGLFTSVGKFDTDFKFGTYEDVALCFAVTKEGYKVIVDTDAVGYHFTNASADGSGISFPLAINQQTFYNKWGDYTPWSDGWLL